MRRSTVIFDLGNVVLFFDHRIICHKLADRYSIDKELIYREIFQNGIEKRFDEGKLTPEEFTDQCSKSLRVTLNLPEFKIIWSDIFTENFPVIEIINKLKKDSYIFLLSNTNEWHFEYIKNQFSIIELFDELILSFKIGFTKPHRMIYKRAIELSRGCSPVVYIDDIQSYVETAKKEGIQEALLYTNAHELRKKLNKLNLIQ